MPSLQETAYPRLKNNPSRQALETIFRPTEDEIALAHRVTRGERSKLCFLLLLKTFQTVGYSVQIAHIPKVIVLGIAEHIHSALTPEDLINYDPSGSRRRHLSIIRDYLGIQAFGAEAKKIMVAAMHTAAQAQHDLIDLINVALEELVRHRYELPGFTTLEQSARKVRAASNQSFYNKIFNAIQPDERVRLDELFYDKPEQVTTDWNELKAEPDQPTVTQLRQLVLRLIKLSSLLMSESVMDLIPEAKRLHFVAQAQALDASQMKELPKNKRYTFAALLCHQQYAQTLDDIAEVFIKRMQKMHYKAKEALLQFRIDSQNRIDELIGTLRDVVIAHSGEGTITVRFKAVDEIVGERSHDIIEQCDAHLALAGNNYFSFLPKYYRSHRAVLFHFLEAVPLHASTQDTTLIDAIQFIQQYQNCRREWISILPDTQDGDTTSVEPILDVSWIPPKWRALVTGVKGKGTAVTQVHRRYFELCVFSHILLELKSGDLYIPGSSSFSDYFQQLLSWEETQAMLPDYAEQLDLPSDPAQFVKHVRSQLDASIKTTDRSFPKNSQVYFRKDRLTIRKIRAKKDPEAEKLKKIIHSRLLPKGVLDVLIETELWIKWSRYFKPISGYEPKLKNPTARYMATVFCYGCNIGPSQLAKSLKLFDRRQIATVHQSHIDDEKLQRANEIVINEYNRFELPKCWGDGTRASVDGTQWDIYEQNLLAEYHIRYGGYGGIAYNHVADTYIALFSHFIPCGVHEAVYLFDGLLNNQSDIQPDTIHGDTHAQSLTVFGLAYLLGIKLMPRIRNWKDLIFFRGSPSQKLKHLDALFSDTVDWKLILSLLPDMWRVVLSIRAGRINASTILRKLGTNSRKNKLFKAFQALGSAVRTTFLMEYIHDAELRSTIHAGTNKSESFNAFVKWIAFGNLGTLTTNNREEQRKRIKYNQLVANCLILHNVSEMSRILNELAQEGYTFSSDCLAHMNPYISDPFIRLGQYLLDMDRRPPVINYKIAGLVNSPERLHRD